MKDPLGRYLQNWRLQKVLPHVRGRLLDLGCGSNVLVRRYGNGVGVDVYPWDEVDHVVEDSAQLPFAAEAFDTVTCIAALNHIPNREAVLLEVWRVLKPGGRLILTMLPPGMSRLWHLLRRPWDADQHERGMTAGEVYGLGRREIAHLIEQAGFSLLRRQSFQWGINNLYLIEKPF